MVPAPAIKDYVQMLLARNRRRRDPPVAEKAGRVLPEDIYPRWPNWAVRHQRSRGQRRHRSGRYAYAIVMEELSGLRLDRRSVWAGGAHRHAAPATGSRNSRRPDPDVLRRKKVAYCITEAEAGSDVSGIRTTATPGADGWRLTGEKLWIHNAPVADTAFVLARTDPAAGHRGMSIFIVDLHAPGVTPGPKEHKMGQRASQVGALNFDDVACRGRCWA